MCVCVYIHIYIYVFYLLSTYEIYTVEHRSNLYRTSITIILKMYQTSTEFLLEITRGYISIIKCKDPTHCIIRSNQLLTFLNTTDYVHTPKSRWRFGRDPYQKKRLTAKAINQLQQWVHLSHLQTSIGQLICTVLHCLPKATGLASPSDS